MSYSTLAVSIAARYPRVSPVIYQSALVLIGSAVIALCSQLSFPLWFSPVPVTAQTFAVLTVGMALGSRNGMLAVLAYLLEGVAGLPVFAGGGAGMIHLIGPTGGYLWGFALCAFVCGKLAEWGFDRKFATTLIAMTVGNLIIFLPGVLWLRQFVPAGQSVALGLIPFLPGAIVKTVAAALLFPSIRKRI